MLLYKAFLSFNFVVSRWCLFVSRLMFIHGGVVVCCVQRALPVRRAAVQTLLLLMRKIHRLQHRQDVCHRLVHGLYSRHSSSFYLPNNTTVCTFASVQFWKSRTARSDKNTNSCPKTWIKTVTGYIFYHTSKILQTRKRDIALFSRPSAESSHDGLYIVLPCNMQAK